MCSNEVVLAQPIESLDSELTVIDAEIVEVEETIVENDFGLIRTLAETRREALLLLRTVVESRKQAEAGGASFEIIVPAIVPDPDRAQRLLGEIAAQQKRIEESELEATSTGGLIQAIALSRVETEKLTLVQLRMAYLQAQYGIAFPTLPDVDNLTSSTSTEDNLGFAVEGYNIDDIEGILEWADTEYPDIDYSLRPFELAHLEGQRISGWWTIKEERAAIDDSPTVISVNYSAYEPNSFSGITSLIAQCREGETSIVFIQDEFLMGDFLRSSFDIAYRIDDEPAQSTQWSELTSSKGAGLFGSRAEGFLRNLYYAKRFFIRLTEMTGRRHDALFDLAGIQVALEAVAGACGWSTFELSRDDYRIIQTMLNVGGFNAGTPDGIWGSESRGAMRAFQEENGIPITGAPDRSTLEALGIRSQDE